MQVRAGRLHGARALLRISRANPGALFFILKQPDAEERYLLQVSAEWAGSGSRYRAQDDTSPRVFGFQSHTVVGLSTAVYGPSRTTAQAAPQGGENDGEPQEGKTKEP